MPGSQGRSFSDILIGMNATCSRRDLLSALALAGAPLRCCETPDIPAAAISFQPGFITIDLRQVPGLARPATAGKIVAPERRLNIIVTHPEKNRFVVMDRKCTHSGGQVAYNRDRKTVQCTCWGHSEFALDGAVVGGPAKRPLRRYDSRVESGKLIVAWEAPA